jgi:hypothetical protein
MSSLVLAEVIAGLIALALTAMAFVNLSWAQGCSSPDLIRKSQASTRRLFIWAGVFWAITFLFAYLSMRGFSLSSPLPPPSDPLP